MAEAATLPAVGEHITVPWWAWAAFLAATFLTYVVFQENGWIMDNWMTVHEFFHDGRHALGFPCH
jgi:hypothetical protein